MRQLCEQLTRGRSVVPSHTHAAVLHENHSSFKADTTHSHVESHLCVEVGVVFNMLGIVLRKIAVWVFRTRLNKDVDGGELNKRN